MTNLGVFDNVPEPILWNILQFVPHRWGAIVCKRFRNCYRNNFIINKLLTSYALIEATLYYRVNDLMFIWCCELGLVHYIQKHHKTGGDNLVYYRQRPIASTTNPLDSAVYDTYKVRRNDKALVKVCSARTPNYLEIFQILMSDPQINPGADHNSALREACESGAVHIIKVLLLADPRTNPGDQNNIAIICACENNRYDIVKLLLADPPD